jgi:hypothetical protein
MGRKLTPEQRTERAIIRKNLNEFGQKIYERTQGLVRVKTTRLIQSLNYKVNPYNVITFAQVYYAKWNTYKGRPSVSSNKKDYNPYLREIEKDKGELKNIIVKDLKESILYKYKNDKPNHNIN